MFSSRFQLITIVNKNTVFFCNAHPSKGYLVSPGIPFESFLTAASPPLPVKFVTGGENLIIVPDYWIGSRIYPLDSTQTSIVEAFIHRKLTAEYPTIPDIVNFYGYRFIVTKDQQPAVYVYFMQDKAFYDFYPILAMDRSRADLITSPAFIGQSKPDLVAQLSDSTNYALIALLPKECSLYFFSQGQFLFSRSIVLPEADDRQLATFEVLTYEINQSRYLYSQRAGTQIERLFILSENPDNALQLSKTLNLEIIDLNQALPERHNTLPKEVGPIALFDEEDWSDATRFLHLSHKYFRKTRAWRFAQMVGIFSGILLFIIFGLEALYLYHVEQPGREPIQPEARSAEMRPPETIHAYNAALDNLLLMTRRASPEFILSKITSALPESLRIEEMDMQTGPPAQVEIKAKVYAPDVDRLQQLLKKMLNRLNRLFALSPPLTLEKIDLVVNDDAKMNDLDEYLIHTRFQLP